MEQYHNVIENTLGGGTFKPNRTGVDTISTFREGYDIDLREGFPLLTTKDMTGYRWNSLIHEVIWYLTGEEHIQNLQKHTKIWDAWANEVGHLETAYGRFWRRFPVPSEPQHLPGEAWADNEWVTTEADGQKTFDQFKYVIDQLKTNPNSRRLVVSAWHPANASVSMLPPCHYTFVFNVQGDGTLNLHLTQRSADIALGVPFNIAAYSILLIAIAQETGFTPGKFGHTLVDAHVYCGQGDRGAWYGENLEELQQRMSEVKETGDISGYASVVEWIENNAPEDDYDSRGNPYDHVPGLLTQLTRDEFPRPTLNISNKPLDELEFDDFTLDGYESHDGIRFGVAE